VGTNLTSPSRSRKTVDIRRPQRERRLWHEFQSLDVDKDNSGRVNNILEAEVVTLYGKVADLEKKNQKLVATLQLYDNARQECESAGQNPQEAQFRTYHQQLWNLEQLNMNLQNNAKFFELGPSQKRSLQEKDINNIMYRIQSKLQSILDNCETTSLQLSTAIKRGSDSEALLLSSLDLHKSPQDLQQRLKECASQFDVSVIVRTLVLSALQDWVFNISFPPFKSERAASLFLESMEEVILDHSEFSWICSNAQ
jgi:hypothetical protein